MRWVVMAGLLQCLMIAGAAQAEGERAGDFDYYVLSLSWSPSWCALEGDARGARECAEPLGFVLHGLWPQHDEGWPSWCRTGQRDPSRAETAAMADLMEAGLAWHQWKKHGRCSGLPARGYYDAMRRAAATVQVPDVFRRLNRDVRLPATVVEAAFLEANPALEPDMITITCREGRIQEARICLTTDLTYRTCAPDSRRDCSLPNAEMDAVR